MKNIRGYLLVSTLSLLASGQAQADVVITTDSRLDGAPYTVAGADLFQTSLTGLTSTGTLYFPDTQISRLADGQFGSTGGDFNSFAFYSGGTVTFELDLAASPQGYDITELVTYAGWDQNRDGQEYAVEYSTAEDPVDFRPLATVPQFNPPGAGASSTRVSLTGLTGMLVRNVARVRFTFTNFESGATFYREIDAIGTPASGATAQVPQLINYQGRIAVGTTNFHGTGQFKFALVNGAGSITYWSNDGTSTGGAMPTAAVTLPVVNGLYSVLLGEPTQANMTSIPAAVFAHPHVRLRVWFDDGVNGFQQLSPDQRIAAVGYAMMAADVPDGIITAAKLAPGAVSVANLADGSITAAKIADGTITAAKLAPGAAATLDTTGNNPLDLKVNGLRGLRLYDPGDSDDTGTESDGAPNLIGGAPGNTIAAGTVGSTIAGGGATSYYGTAFANSIAADFSFIGGGYGNGIQAGARFGFIGAGRFNGIQTDALESVINGGLNNVIQANAFRSAIVGGEGNVVQTGAIYSTIAGGYLNSISGSYAFVAGGESNAAGPASFAAGHRAKATHAGSFVWADATDVDFPSTVDNQFSVRAGGGARFETAGAGLMVDGSRVLTEATSVAGLSDGSVTAAKLAPAAVTSSGLADAAVTTAKLAAAAVTAGKLASNAVTTASLADGSVTAAKLADGAISLAAIGDGLIPTAKLADGAVTADKLAAGAVTTPAIMDGSITAAKFAPGAVGVAGIPDGSITAAKLAPGAVDAILSASTQAGVPAGGLILSATDNPDLAAAGYLRIGTAATTDLWQRRGGANPPLGRSMHTAVWTGAEMLVWGGLAQVNAQPQYLGAGGSYNVATNTWAAMTSTDEPLGRVGHTAVWTGTEMLVWGGTRSSSLNPTGMNSGARYEPNVRGDRWTAISAIGAPSPRSGHTAIWTGNRMIVWGGTNGSTYLNDGGIYDPMSDTWTPISVANAPTARSKHTAVWTGTEMIVWGGFDGTAYALSGARYRPYNDSWVAVNISIPPNSDGSYMNQPDPRENHTAVWTGTEMIVWGGQIHRGAGSLGTPDYDSDVTNTGGRYDPVTNGWRNVSVAGAPSSRSGQVGVWTGTEMIICGGASPSTDGNTGKRYNPTDDSWTTVPLLEAPLTRKYHTAVWTGNEMIVWGGEQYGDDTDVYRLTPGRVLYLYLRP